MQQKPGGRQAIFLRVADTQLANHQDLRMDLSVLPVGDGITLVRKR